VQQQRAKEPGPDKELQTSLANVFIQKYYVKGWYERANFVDEREPRSGDTVYTEERGKDVKDE
jgi:hypothetical protein